MCLLTNNVGQVHLTYAWIAHKNEAKLEDYGTLPAGKEFGCHDETVDTPLCQLPVFAAVIVECRRIIYFSVATLLMQLLVRRSRRPRWQFQCDLGFAWLSLPVRRVSSSEDLFKTQCLDWRLDISDAARCLPCWAYDPALASNFQRRMIFVLKVAMDQASCKCTSYAASWKWRSPLMMKGVRPPVEKSSPRCSRSTCVLYYNRNSYFWFYADVLRLSVPIWLLNTYVLKYGCM